MKQIRDVYLTGMSRISYSEYEFHMTQKCHKDYSGPDMPKAHSHEIGYIYENSWREVKNILAKALLS